MSILTFDYIQNTLSFIEKNTIFFKQVFSLDKIQQRTKRANIQNLDFLSKYTTQVTLHVPLVSNKIFTEFVKTVHI